MTTSFTVSSILSNTTASDTSAVAEENNATTTSSSDEIDDTLVWGNKNGFHFFQISNESYAPTSTIEDLNRTPSNS